MDRWESLPILCTGGLILDTDALSQGTNFPGSARILQNYECAVNGGYRRINGYQKWDDDVVPGTGPVLGVVVGVGGVIAVRQDGSSYDIQYSAGGGWTQVNTAPRNNAVEKARGASYNLFGSKVAIVDGANPALIYDGSTDVLVTGTGAPVDPKYVTTFRNRLVLSGYSANDSAVSLSAPNTDDDFDGTNGAIEFSVGDTVVGLYTFRDELYVFCEKSIWKLSGLTTADYTVDSVTRAIGCVSGDTIQEVGGDLTFLAPDGFRSVAATARIGDIEMGLTSQRIRPLVRDIVTIGLNENRFSSCTIPSKSQYRVFVRQDNYTEENSQGFIGKLNPRDDTGLSYDWSTTVGIMPYCADSSYIGNQEVIVFGHPSNGYVFRMEQGADFDGTTIISVYRTPDITFDDATLRKVFQKLDLYTQVEGDLQLDINLILDRENLGTVQPQTIQITQTGVTPVYGTAEYGFAQYGAVTYPVFKRNLVGSGFVAALSFATNSTKPTHRIDSFQLQFGRKGRR